MASNSSKTPPSLSKCKTYEDWLELIKVWRHFTDLSKTRQGSALVLFLEDEAPDAVLEIDEDFRITRYQTLEAFETLKRPSNMSIQSFLIIHLMLCLRGQ